MIFTKLRKAPLTWAIYYLGLLLNRDGAAEERLGARIMAWAVERLAKKAGVS